MVVKMLISDESGPPTCDRAGCNQPWPGPPGHQMPGGYRINGRDSKGRPAISLYCSEACAQADEGYGCDGLGTA
jgi:hypothetical protein